MSLDLSAAVEAARMSDAVLRAQTVGDVVVAAVAAAAPLIEAQVRAQIAHLDPAESIALTVATAQVGRGEPVTPNVGAVCVMALARIARGESS